jgi:branched-chain amino acid transport system permease protein
MGVDGGPRERRRERLDRGIKVRAESIYAVSSLKEIIFLLGPRLTLFLGLLALPLLMPNLYWQKVLCIFGVYALLSISFDFLANFNGLVCLGGAFFVGVGGYISGILNSTLGLSPAFTIPIGAVGGAMICTLCLLPCFPLRGPYFAIVTFIYPLVMERLIASTRIFGGTEGISGLAMATNIWSSQYIIIVVVFVSMFGLRRLVNQDVGLVFHGIKDNEQAIRASGMSITYYKAMAVFIAALVGCFAGAYLGYLYGWVGMSLFAIDFSILPLAATVVGGPGTLVGPVLGSLILVPISEVLRALGTLRVVFYSICIVFFAVFFSEGLLNYFRRKYEQFEHWVRV